MLSFDPLPHLGEKALRAEDPDHRAEGKQLDEKLCLVGRVIIEGADPGIGVRLVDRLLFIIGKMKHKVCLIA